MSESAVALPHGELPDDDPSDDALVLRVRDGDSAAYGELWRRHAPIATSIARRYYEIADADDIVAEAFARVLSAIKNGGGPQTNFRAYLITSIGNVARRWATQSRTIASDDLDRLEDVRTTDDPVVAGMEQRFALDAFKSLPARWQTVLWYSAVEGMATGQIAGYLGLTPNATAATIHRARKALRAAWVQAHLNSAELADDCQWVTARLGRWAAGALGPRELARVSEHVARCAACSVRAKEMKQLTSRLGALLIPALLGLGWSQANHQPSDPAAIDTITRNPVASPTSTSILSAKTVFQLAAVAVIVTVVTVAGPSTFNPTGTGEIGAPAPSQDSTNPDDGPAVPSSDRPEAPGVAPTDEAGGPDQAGSPPDGAAGPSAPAPPPAPVLAFSTSIDPTGLFGPAVAGTAFPGATVLLTDELGNSLASVVADAAGSWSVPALDALSPAAAELIIRQVDTGGVVSAPVSTPANRHPLVVGPAAGTSYDLATPVILVFRCITNASVSVSVDGQYYTSFTTSGTDESQLFIIPPAIYGPGGVFIADHVVTMRYTDATRQGVEVATPFVLVGP